MWEPNLKQLEFLSQLDEGPMCLVGLRPVKVEKERMIGTVSRMIIGKHFGFIRVMKDDYFFHRDDFTGHWNDLLSDYTEGKSNIEVSFEVSERKDKGLRAERVMRIDHPNRGD